MTMTPTKTRKWVNASKVIIQRVASQIDELNNSYVINSLSTVFTHNPDPQEGVDRILAAVISLTSTVSRQLEHEISYNPKPERVALFKAAWKELSHITKSYNRDTIPKV